MEVRHFGFDAALALLKQRRPLVNPGESFVSQLKEREGVKEVKKQETGRRRMQVPSLLMMDHRVALRD
jgi:hypothetical protein